MSMTRRRMLSLAGALAALAMPVTAIAGESVSETFTLIRSGSVTMITDAHDTQVYIRAGSAEIMTPGSAERLSELLTVVRQHREDGVYEIRLPAEGQGAGERG